MKKQTSTEALSDIMVSPEKGRPGGSQPLLLIPCQIKQRIPAGTSSTTGSPPEWVPPVPSEAADVSIQHPWLSWSAQVLRPTCMQDTAGTAQTTANVAPECSASHTWKLHSELQEVSASGLLVLKAN